jgi:hypothetical protein
MLEVGYYTILEGTLYTWKCPSMREWILLIEGLPTILRMHPNLLATFCFYFILLSLIKLFNIQELGGKWKHCITTLAVPLLFKSFLMVPS